jgi:hypothetical protein
MDKQNANHLQEETEKKHQRRAKRRKGKMKVSGSKVKGLQRIIINKLKTQNSKRKTTT